MMSTRPCKYCLRLQGDSVFADFDVDNDGYIFLIRISFDGYGCCSLEEQRRKMNAEESRRLIEWIESDNVNHDAMSAVLIKYFDENKDVIWGDALADHELL